jgi:hypothetical protein
MDQQPYTVPDVGDHVFGRLEQRPRGRLDTCTSQADARDDRLHMRATQPDRRRENAHGQPPPVTGVSAIWRISIHYVPLHGKSIASSAPQKSGPTAPSARASAQFPGHFAGWPELPIAVITGIMTLNRSGLPHPD